MGKLETFIEKAKQIHGDKYDYSKSEYIGNDIKVCIICHKKDKFGNEITVIKPSALDENSPSYQVWLDK